jgi:protein-tyrosine phosphatase
LHAAESVPRAGFDTLVLCANDHQPPSVQLRGLYVVRCPLDDNPYRPVDSEEWGMAIGAAEEALRALARGERVLVTCRMGLNRSGLVCALVLVLNGRRPAEAIAHIQRRRPGALNNPEFVKALMRLS